MGQCGTFSAADMLFSPAWHSDQPQSDELKVEVRMYICTYSTYVCECIISVSRCQQLTFRISSAFSYEYVCCSHTHRTPPTLFHSWSQLAPPSSSQLEKGQIHHQTTHPPHQRARWLCLRTLILERGCNAHAHGTESPHGGQGIGPLTQASVCAVADQWKGHPTGCLAVQLRVAPRPHPQLPPLP